MQIRKFGNDIGIEISIEKCAMNIIKSGRRQIIEEIELLKEEKSECSDQRKITNTWE